MDDGKRNKLARGLSKLLESRRPRKNIRTALNSATVFLSKITGVTPKPRSSCAGEKNKLTFCSRCWYTNVTPWRGRIQRVQLYSESAQNRKRNVSSSNDGSSPNLSPISSDAGPAGGSKHDKQNITSRRVCGSRAPALRPWRPPSFVRNRRALHLTTQVEGP